MILYIVVLQALNLTLQTIFLCLLKLIITQKVLNNRRNFFNPKSRTRNKNKNLILLKESNKNLFLITKNAKN